MYNCIKYLYELSSSLLLRLKLKGLHCSFNKLKIYLITLPAKQTHTRGPAESPGEGHFSLSPLLFSRGGGKYLWDAVGDLATHCGPGTLLLAWETDWREKCFYVLSLVSFDGAEALPLISLVD